MLHQRAAAALEPLAAAAPERGGEVAAHLLRAAPGPAALRQAARWAAAAAQAATAALAFEDAARYLGHRTNGGRPRRERPVILPPQRTGPCC